MAVRGPQRRGQLCTWLLVWAAAACMVRLGGVAQTAFANLSQTRARLSVPQPGVSATRLAAGGMANLGVENPVKTVSETLADFYTQYPQPPVLPLYRPMLVDFLTQTHLAVADTRFVYDAVFALGLSESFMMLMGRYDKLLGSQETEKIWKAFLSAVGLDPERVRSDADALSAFAKTSSLETILKQKGDGKEGSVGHSLENLGAGLWTLSKSVGLFRVMELTGTEASKASVEEWAKALNVASSRPAGDLETYKANKLKLQRAEEMLREVEIREKKKLAERLEEKAKALAAKAAAAAASEKEGAQDEAKEEAAA